MYFGRLRNYLFYLFVFSIPWQTRWIIRDPSIGGEAWEYGRISLYGWDILLVLLLVLNWRAVATQITQLRQAASNAATSNEGRAFLFSLLFVAYVLITAPWAHGVVAFVWAWRLLLAVLGLWLLVSAIKPRLEYVLASLAAAGTVQALWALWQLATQQTFANKWLGVAVHSLTQGGTSVVLTATGRWLRSYGGQVHPNVLGGLLAVTLLATAWLITHDWKRGTHTHLWLRLAYLVQLGGLFTTFSRGAWLAFFVTLGLWWWRVVETRRSLRPVLLASLGVFVVLSALWWQPVVGRLLGGSRLEQQSVDERVGGLRDSRELLDQGWWRGLGIGSYTAVLITKHPNLQAWQYQPVHNVPLLSLLELGIVGFLLLLGLAWVRLAPFALRTHLLLVPILITGLFDHYWWTMPSMMLLAWLLVTVPLGQEKA